MKKPSLTCAKIKGFFFYHVIAVSRAMAECIPGMYVAFCKGAWVRSSSRRKSWSLDYYFLQEIFFGDVHCNRDHALGILVVTEGMPQEAFRKGALECCSKPENIEKKGIVRGTSPLFYETLK